MAADPPTKPSDLGVESTCVWLRHDLHPPSPFNYYSARELILILLSHGGWKAESTYAHSMQPYIILYRTTLHMGVRNLPKVFTRQRPGRESNPVSAIRKSDALPVSHRATRLDTTYQSTTAVFSHYQSLKPTASAVLPAAKVHSCSAGMPISCSLILCSILAVQVYCSLPEVFVTMHLGICLEAVPLQGEVPCSWGVRTAKESIA